MLGVFCLWVDCGFDFDVVNEDVYNYVDKFKSFFYWLVYMNNSCLIFLNFCSVIRVSISVCMYMIKILKDCCVLIVLY